MAFDRMVACCRVGAGVGAGGGHLWHILLQHQAKETQCELGERRAHVCQLHSS